MTHSGCTCDTVHVSGLLHHRRYAAEAREVDEERERHQSPQSDQSDRGKSQGRVTEESHRSQTEHSQHTVQRARGAGEHRPENHSHGNKIPCVREEQQYLEQTLSPGG